MNWQIYYSDGTTISSEDMSPFNIPEPYHEGVQVIIQGDDKHKWKTLCDVDYYVWDDRGKGEKWWRVNDLFGLSHYLRQPGQKCVLFGAWIETEDFNRIFNQARKSWGDKHIYATDERHP